MGPTGSEDSVMSAPIVKDPHFEQPQFTTTKGKFVNRDVTTATPAPLNSSTAQQTDPTVYFQGPFYDPATEEPSFNASGTEEPSFNTPGTEEPSFLTPVTEEPYFPTPVTEEPSFHVPETQELSFHVPETQESANVPNAEEPQPEAPTPVVEPIPTDPDAEKPPGLDDSSNPIAESYQEVGPTLPLDNEIMGSRPPWLSPQPQLNLTEWKQPTHVHDSASAATASEHPQAEPSSEHPEPSSEYPEPSSEHPEPSSEHPEPSSEYPEHPEPSSEYPETEHPSSEPSSSEPSPEPSPEPSDEDFFNLRLLPGDDSVTVVVQSQMVPCLNSDKEIDSERVCDGSADCPGATDELNCCRRSLDPTMVCDGVYDCPNLEDEIGCSRGNHLLNVLISLNNSFLI